MDTLIEGVYQAREGPGGSIKAQFQGELDRLKALCEKMARSSHRKARELGGEFLNDWDAIFRVLDHPELPMTNNAAEQRLRHWVILRRISQGTRNKKGSKALALIASVIETCRQRKASPLRYLNSGDRKTPPRPRCAGLAADSGRRVRALPRCYLFGLTTPNEWRVAACIPLRRSPFPMRMAIMAIPYIFS